MMKGTKTRLGARTAYAAVCALALVGCYQHTIQVGAGAPRGRIVYDHWTHHWLWGLVSPSEDIYLSDLCPSGNATIRGEATFLNGLVSALTSGIYSPTTVTVRCASGGSEDLELDEDAVEEIVSDPAFLDWVGAVSPELLEKATEAQRFLQQ